MNLKAVAVGDQPVIEVARTPNVAPGTPAGANSVDVSADRGKHWYRAFLGGVVGAVVGSDRELFAFTGAPGAYYSKNGGRVWHYNKSFF